jgi:transcriptional regulator with XRE-family HTH domain
MDGQSVCNREVPLPDTWTANATFARRLVEARKSAGLSQAKLAARLRDVVGYVDDKGKPLLSRQAIAEIENAKVGRRVSVDEWLALSAAVGACPLYMVTPRESPEVVSVEAAEMGVFEAPVHLRVSDRLTLHPSAARRWIRGKEIFDGAPLADWTTYFCVEVPPAYSYRLKQAAAFVRGHAQKLGRWKLPPVEIPIEEEEHQLYGVGVRDEEGNEVGVPQSLWTWIKSERELEEGS